MKILIGYVPLESPLGIPLLSQNRQFQWFSRPTYVYPMVPASAATLLKTRGHDVLWLDGIAEELTQEEFDRRFLAFQPDLFLLETKTPVVKRTWQKVDHLKTLLPHCRIVLCGDHATALPEESLRSCKADFILRGGDYDFALDELVRWMSQNGGPDADPNAPAHAPLPCGFAWHGPDGAIRDSGNFCNRRHSLADLPEIDRELTQWQLYSRKNGNFRKTPGTYTMVARDCWWGKCTFCSWTTLYPEWRFRTPTQLLDEIGHLIERYRVREIFDDSGCFPAGAWLREFCEGMVARGYHRKVTLGCNMIPGALDAELYKAMAKAGFRFVLFGLESAQPETLARINKCPAAREIEQSMKLAREAGLLPHVTCMIGYPWETAEDAHRTIALTRKLFDRGYIATLQGTIVIPYPGTPLFRECKANGWLRTEDWDRYDMREPIMRCPVPDEELMALVRKLYESFLTPRFVLRQLLSIRSWNDLLFLGKAALRVAGHLLDFHAAKRPRQKKPAPTEKRSS